jgi:hypothetical protein
MSAPSVGGATARAPRTALRSTRLSAIGACALFLSLAHDGWHLARGEWHDLFWFCNLSCPLLGLGCLLRNGPMVRVALTWFLFGTPLWVLDQVTGGEVIVTGILVHLGGPLLGALALPRFGWQRGTWRLAWLASLGVWALARLVTPPAANVNLAFRVWPGWEGMFPHYGAYVLLLLASAALVFFLLERVVLAAFPTVTSTTELS